MSQDPMLQGRDRVKSTRILATRRTLILHGAPFTCFSRHLRTVDDRKNASWYMVSFSDV